MDFKRLEEMNADIQAQRYHITYLIENAGMQDVQEAWQELNALLDSRDAELLRCVRVLSRRIRRNQRRAQQ